MSQNEVTTHDPYGLIGEWWGEPLSVRLIGAVRRAPRERLLDFWSFYVRRALFQPNRNALGSLPPGLDWYAGVDTWWNSPAYDVFLGRLLSDAPEPIYSGTIWGDLARRLGQPVIEALALAGENGGGVDLLAVEDVQIDFAARTLDPADAIRVRQIGVDKIDADIEE